MRKQEDIFFIIMMIGVLLFISAHILSFSLKMEKQNRTIAEVLASEGCGEGKVGMYLIANTIANRSKQWNKTPYEIVTQPNQYYGLIHPNKNELYNQCKSDADELARKILELPDLTDGALYFRQTREPKMKWHNIETIRWKNHIFYK